MLYEVITLKDFTRKLALALKVKGLINVQFAEKGGIVYVLEVNPRASRTVPFISKAMGVPLAKIVITSYSIHYTKLYEASLS